MYKYLYKIILYNWHYFFYRCKKKTMDTQDMFLRKYDEAYGRCLKQSTLFRKKICEGQLQYLPRMSKWLGIPKQLQYQMNEKY